MAKRWVAIAGIVFALACLLLAVLWSQVSREILVGTEWKTVSKITVSGMVTGEPEYSAIERSKVTAEAFPKPRFGSGITSTPINGFGGIAYIGGIFYDYQFDVPMERQATLTYRTVNIFNQVIGKPIVRHENYKAEYQIIKLLPPAGWKATPSEYKVSKDMNKADFEMGRVEK